MKVRDVIKALEREGWRLDRQTTKRASIVNTATPTDLGPSRWLAS
jgi:predicted RNA binding protein YcfA (HicA-like mRNA interferase family)